MIYRRHLDFFDALQKRRKLSGVGLGIYLFAYSLWGMPVHAHNRGDGKSLFTFYQDGVVDIHIGMTEMDVQDFFSVDLTHPDLLVNREREALLTSKLQTALPIVLRIDDVSQGQTSIIPNAQDSSQLDEDESIPQSCPVHFVSWRRTSVRDLEIYGRALCTTLPLQARIRWGLFALDTLDYRSIANIRVVNVVAPATNPQNSAENAPQPPQPHDTPAPQPNPTHPQNAANAAVSTPTAPTTPQTATEANPQKNTQNQWAGEPKKNQQTEKSQQTIFSRHHAEQTFVLQEPSRLSVSLQFMVLGIEHILLGWDHLCFLLALLLACARLKQVLWIISGFTIAHSITLILSTYQIISPPDRLVETIIALSITISALLMAFRYRQGLLTYPGSSLSGNQSTSILFTLGLPIVLCFGFGLIHGFGFAAMLRNLLRQQDSIALPLGFFNLGVELGQIFCVLLAFPLLMRLCRSRWQSWIVYSLAGFLSFVSLLAGISRFLELPWAF